MVWSSIIAKRLKQARKRAGISSQRKLGILAGIDLSGASSRMNQYETGKHTPDIQILTLIGAVLDTPVPYFYCKDNQLARLILKFGTLDEAQKKQLLAFANKL
jgi:transcriptional regulator with XRE-family HTH domain